MRPEPGTTFKAPAKAGPASRPEAKPKPQAYAKPTPKVKGQPERSRRPRRRLRPTRLGAQAPGQAAA